MNKEEDFVLNRREFLFSFGGGISLLGIFKCFQTPLVIDKRRDIAPGSIIRVLLPYNLDPTGYVLHEIDNREVSRSPIPKPSGLIFRVIEVEAMPLDRRLRAGRHEFYLIMGKRRLSLGGFDVKPFRFGF